MSGSVGASPVDLYLTDSVNEASRAASTIKSDAQATALITYFKAVAPTLTTPDALLKNYKALSVVLGAFNLSGSINNTAILRKLLTQDPASKTSLAQTLGNTKYQLLANALSNWTTPPFATSQAVSQVVNAFSLNSYEAKAGAQTPGLADALYFTREAASLKSVAAVQSDSNLLGVVVTGLGLPLENFEELDFDQQTSILNAKLNPSNLQKPAYVKHMAEQYLVAQQTNAVSAPAAGSIASLYSDETDTSGDALLSILDPDPAGSNSSSGSGASVLSLFA